MQRPRRRPQREVSLRPILGGRYVKSRDAEALGHFAHMSLSRDPELNLNDFVALQAQELEPRVVGLLDEIVIHTHGVLPANAIDSSSDRGRNAERRFILAR